MNKKQLEQSSFLSGPLVASMAVLALMLVANREPSLDSMQAQAAGQDPVKLTSTLVAWISSQAESVIRELEAIANENAASNQFSVVNYIRYLALFEDLKVIANRKDVDKLQWVAKKVKALSRAHGSAVEILTGYLLGLDDALSKIEASEPKSKQVEVGKDWVQLYQTINYIATHVPRDYELAKTATAMLQKSPNGSLDKQRATRYKLKTQAFH